MDDTLTLALWQCPYAGSPSQALVLLDAAGETGGADGPMVPLMDRLAAASRRAYRALVDAEGFVKKIGHIDLMDINDPQGVAKRGGKNGKFTFPFVTIEDVDVVDSDHLIVANDNNLPYSAGRLPNQQDDNEFILLHAPEFLRAR